MHCSWTQCWTVHNVRTYFGCSYRVHNEEFNPLQDFMAVICDQQCLSVERQLYSLQCHTDTSQSKKLQNIVG